ncbi:unnamed protein product, partial [Prorocentrum cordatum]
GPRPHERRGLEPPHLGRLHLLVLALLGRHGARARWLARVWPGTQPHRHHVLHGGAGGPAPVLADLLRPAPRGVGRAWPDDRLPDSEGGDRAQPGHLRPGPVLRCLRHGVQHPPVQHRPDAVPRLLRVHVELQQGGHDRPVGAAGLRGPAESAVGHGPGVWHHRQHGGVHRLRPLQGAAQGRQEVEGRPRLAHPVVRKAWTPGSHAFRFCSVIVGARRKPGLIIFRHAKLAELVQDCTRCLRNSGDLAEKCAFRLCRCEFEICVSMPIGSAPLYIRHSLEKTPLMSHD